MILQSPDTLDFDWQQADQPTLNIPTEYHYWIHLPGSLTEALRQRSDQFRVEVAEEGFTEPEHVPASLASVTDDRFFWSRKVWLKSGDQIWVAAHTLVPKSSLDKGLTKLTTLNEQPLGELLFTTEGVVKDAREVSCTRLGWGRRARFWLYSEPLLVTEFFMDALISHERQRLSSLPETNPT